MKSKTLTDWVFLSLDAHESSRPIIEMAIPSPILTGDGPDQQPHPFPSSLTWIGFEMGRESKARLETASAVPSLNEAFQRFFQGLHAATDFGALRRFGPEPRPEASVFRYAIGSDEFPQHDLAATGADAQGREGGK